MRVFAILVVQSEDGKMVICNRKRCMPPKLARYEGKLNLFGGLVNEGETPKDAILRELDEEIGFVPDDSDGMRTIFSNENFVVVAINIATECKRIDYMRYFQAEYPCNEGVPDFIYPERIDKEEWLDSQVADMVRVAMA